MAVLFLGKIGPVKQIRVDFFKMNLPILIEGEKARCIGQDLLWVEDIPKALTP